MPGVRGVVVAMACLVGAVLGLNGATLADATLAACGAGQSGQVAQSGQARFGEPVRPERAVLAIEPAARPAGGALLAAVCATRPGAPAPPARRFTATATRHLSASAASLPPGVNNPVTDRVMVLVVGWAVLALVGGGLFARRRELAPAGQRQPDVMSTGRWRSK